MQHGSGTRSMQGPGRGALSLSFNRFEALPMRRLHHVQSVILTLHILQ